MASIEDEADEIIREGGGELDKQYHETIHQYKHAANEYFNELKNDDLADFSHKLSSLYNEMRFDANSLAEFEQLFNKFIKLVRGFLKNKVPKEFFLYLEKNLSYYKEKISGKRIEVQITVLRAVIMDLIQLVNEIPSSSLEWRTMDSIIPYVELRHLHKSLGKPAEELDNSVIEHLETHFGKEQYGFVYRRLVYDILRFSAYEMSLKGLDHRLKRAYFLIQEAKAMEFKKEEFKSYADITKYADKFYNRCMTLFSEFIDKDAVSKAIANNMNDYTGTFGEIAYNFLPLLMQEPYERMKRFIDTSWEVNKRIVREFKVSLERKFKLLQFFLIELIYITAQFHCEKYYHTTHKLLGGNEEEGED